MLVVDNLFDELRNELALDEEQEKWLAICLVAHIGETIEDDFEMSYEYEKEAEEYKKTNANYLLNNR